MLKSCIMVVQKTIGKSCAEEVDAYCAHMLRLCHEATWLPHSGKIQAGP